MCWREQRLLHSEHLRRTSHSGIPILINSNDQLGTTTSSRRFKDQIEPMDKASEAILALKPFFFHYKKNSTPRGITAVWFDCRRSGRSVPTWWCATRTARSTPCAMTQVNAILLNEFLKERRKVEKLEATVAQQQKEFRTFAAEHRVKCKRSLRVSSSRRRKFRK